MKLGEREGLTLPAPALRLYGDFMNYEAALAEATQSAYETEDMVTARLWKARELKAHGTFSGLIGCGLETRQLLKATGLKTPWVLDFGGGYGAGSDWAPAGSRWASVDLPQCVETAAEFATGYLQHFTSIREAKSWLRMVDVVYVNSVFQYLPNPEDTLQTLLSLGARWLIFLRTVLGPARKVQMIEAPLSWEYKGTLPPGMRDRLTRYPCTVMAQDTFFRTCQDAGYELKQTLQTTAWASFQNEQFLFEKV